MDVSKIISGFSVSAYNADLHLSECLLSEDAAQVTSYTRSQLTDRKNDAITLRRYSVLQEISDCSTTVCILNDDAVKVLVAMYPSAPRYVLVQISLRWYFALALLGLARRFFAGLVHFHGLAKLKDGEGNTYRWIVLSQSGKAAQKVLMLPEKIGIVGFIDWLNKEQINYVVLRFFEKLPSLYREGGDLDLLVSDESKEFVDNFLLGQKNLLSESASDIRLGISNVSGEDFSIPAYPPAIARKILDEAILGQAGARVPNEKDALLALIYHCLYHAHKGYSCGIPSALRNHTEAFPENDYLGIITKKAEKVGVEVGNTMEDMDEYLAAEGWRPKLDTLAKIAETNAWVQDRFFAKAGAQELASGLSVFVVRDWVMEEGLVDDVIKTIEQEGFSILRTKMLEGERKKVATEELRGGTWGTNENGEEKGMHPAFAIVALDTQCVRLPKVYAQGFERFRIRKLKEVLRNKLDTHGRSSIHSTDNTRESWEYIEICFPESVGELRDEIQKESQGFSLRAWLHTLSPKYAKHAIKQSVRDFVIRKFLS